MQKWDKLFFCKSLVTMESPTDYGIINDAAIAVKNGLIVWLGKREELTSPEKLTLDIHDFSNYCLTPGLIDCHTHLVYAGNRANEFAMRLQGMSYADIAKKGGGIRATVNATRLATEDQLFLDAYQRLKCLLQEGVTTVEIKSGYGLDLETECRILQVAKKLEQHFPVTIYPTFLGAHATPIDYSSDAYIDEICHQIIPEISRRQLAKAVDVFCENIGFSLSQTLKVFEAAKQNGLAIKCHAEQLSDLKASQLAAKFQALSVDHLEYISEESVKALSQSGTTAVLLPGAFYTLQEKQKPPISFFREYQVPMAIATDCNPGTSPICSLLLILNMACILFGLTPFEAFAGVTKFAARALGMENSRGTLKIGKTADFAIWNIEHPVDLCYSVGFNACVVVVKNGKVNDKLTF